MTSTKMRAKFVQFEGSVEKQEKKILSLARLYVEVVVYEELSNQ